jgi:hypothetical protein
MSAVRTLSNSITDKLDKIESRASNLKVDCQNFSNIINAGAGLDSNRVLSFGNGLSAYVSQINSILSDADLSAISAEGQNRHNDNLYDLSAGLNDLKTAILSCAAYIDSTVPKDVTNTYYLTTVVGVNGSSSSRQFTAAQLIGFVAELSGILAAID